MTPTHSHFACAVIWRRAAEGPEFLVVDSRSTDPKTGQKSALQVKFPGGTNRECRDESVADTLAREVSEETHLIFRRAKEIWKKEISAEHTQYGFLVSIDFCRGYLRRTPFVDDGDELSPPRWVLAKTLGRELFHSHQGVYLAACRELGIL